MRQLDQRFTGALAAAGLVIGAGACAAIIGIDDRQTDPELVDGSVTDSTTDQNNADTQPGDGTPPDVANDAATDSQADGGSGCDDGGLCVLASGLNHPYGVTIDQARTAIYWTNYGTLGNTSDGTVMKCAVGGCNNSPTVLASGLNGATWITADDTAVYWSNANAGTILKCALNGCNNTPIILDQVQDSSDVPRAIAVDATSIYWMESGNLALIHKANKSDGMNKQILANADAGLDTPYSCIVDGTTLFFSDEGFTNFIGSVPTGGGNVSILATNTGCGCYLAVDSSNLFWVNSYYSTATVTRASKTVADSGTIILMGQNGPVDMKLDQGSNTIYVANFGSDTQGVDDGTLVKVPTIGGNPTTLGSSLQTPEGITFDATYLYWLTSGPVADDAGNTAANSGVLYKQPK